MSGMASRTNVELTDDVDGKPAAETVTFGLDGREYEIDLPEKNAKALRKTLEPQTASARRVSGRSTTRGARGAGAAARVETGVDIAAVRAWAASKGHRALRPRPAPEGRRPAVPRRRQLPPAEARPHAPPHNDPRPRQWTAQTLAHSR
jgi:hypothetical protein